MQYAQGELFVRLVTLTQDEKSETWSATMEISGFDRLSGEDSLHEKTFTFFASSPEMAENMAAHMCNRWISDNLKESAQRF